MTFNGIKEGRNQKRKLVMKIQRLCRITSNAKEAPDDSDALFVHSFLRQFLWLSQQVSPPPQRIPPSKLERSRSPGALRINERSKKFTGVIESGQKRIELPSRRSMQ